MQGTAEFQLPVHLLPSLAPTTAYAGVGERHLISRVPIMVVRSHDMILAS